MNKAQIYYLKTRTRYGEKTCQNFYKDVFKSSRNQLNLQKIKLTDDRSMDKTEMFNKTFFGG